MVDPTPRPLVFSRSPRLDAALQGGWERLLAAARESGPTILAEWMAARAGDPDLAAEVAELAAPLLDPVAATDPDARLEALAALAELADETGDDPLADAFWEGALAAGLETADADVVAEATNRLAAIAERNGDPLAAAEFQIDFLNWRRQPEHASDPEQVEAAFDEVVRLAEADGARKEAALWAFRLSRFSRLAAAEEERATAGDWEDDPAPYAAWG